MTKIKKSWPSLPFEKRKDDGVSRNLHAGLLNAGILWPRETFLHVVGRERKKRERERKAIITSRERRILFFRKLARSYDSINRCSGRQKRRKKVLQSHARVLQWHGSERFFMCEK